MNRWLKSQSLSVLLASLAFLAPPAPVWAQEPAAPQTRIVTDVALGPGGTLNGTVVDRKGNRVRDAHVEIRSGKKRLVETLAANDGSFQIHALRGGVYEVTTNGHTSFARLWVESTAPPHATSTPNFVAEESIVRGQSCGADCQCDACGGGYLAGGNSAGHAPMAFLLNPIVIGAAVTAAVAIPLALDDDDDEVVDPAS